jgi:predicted 2-oxoglutarate/Fe(II)-dependent dioxygenase YbiX
MQTPTKQSDTLNPGDIFPRLSLTGPRGEAVDSNAPPMAGRSTLWIVSGHDATATSALLARLASQRDRIESLGVRCYFVTRPGRPKPSGPITSALPGLGKAPQLARGAGPAPVTDIGELRAGAMRLIDLAGEVFRLTGVDGDDPGLLAVGPNRHVIDIVGGAKPRRARTGAEDGGADIVDDILSLLERRAQHRAAYLPAIHPPVLTIPDVFSPADCAHLISIFHTRGQEFVEPGHLALGNRTTDCKMRIPDLGRRDRIDHWVVEADTQALITARLRARLFPEVLKAFNYRVTRHERYRIARYEGERGGEQLGHRDNVEPSVAHRRFAVTINLNAQDYQGGELRFPEFSDQLYKPGSGAAVVFSCSLLHEVVGMREGSRFAILAFLFGEH